jgi:formylmethanofuran dehydrogenase subunit A
MRSATPQVAEAFNKYPNLTTDAGAVLFGESVTLTADGPWQYLLYQLTGKKWANLDVENETGCGIVPYVYKNRSLVNAVQWAAGLELMLLIDDPWRVHLTTDHPNGGCFWRYPEIIQLLMDKEFRKEQIKLIAPKAKRSIVLGDLDREYTLSEIAIVTSAGPARALGLSQKGHLGAGADADITIYPAAKDGQGLLFSYPRYVLKGGEVVVEEGDVRTVTDGKEFIVQPAYDDGIAEYLRPLFEKTYTMSFANYPVEVERVKGADVRKLP